jgi:hypothetical protein
MLVKDGYKGSGIMGICFWAFNGQTANRTEANRNLHVVTRVSYPFWLEIKYEPGFKHIQVNGLLEAKFLLFL